MFKPDAKCADCLDSGYLLREGFPPVPCPRGCGPDLREVLADLDRRIITRDLDALERSLTLRGLQEVWVKRITCKEGFSWEPTLGVSWGTWLAVLHDRGLEVRPVVTLLSEAGVLTTRAFSPELDRVFEERSWR